MLQERRARDHRAEYTQLHGTRGDAHKSAGGDGQCRCEGTLSHLWKVIATRSGP